MSWISRYLTLLEVRETNRAREVQTHRTDETRLADDRLAFEREVFHVEREEKAALARKNTAPQAIVIPPDLEAVIMEESADWLREEMRQKYKAMFVEYGDWNKVRTGVGIGHIDEVTG